MLLLVLVVTAAIRIRLLDIPLDRDEGEYAYIGHLLLEGVPPMASAYTMKMPGIHAVYAVILSVLGRTPAAIHAGLLLVNAAGIVLVFRLGRRVFDERAGLAAAVAFATLTLSPRMMGFAAYAEHFLLVPVLGAILVLLRGLDTGRTRTVFVAGLLLGAGFLLKQTAAFFVLFGLAVILMRPGSGQGGGARSATRGAGALLGGAALPFALLALGLGVAGTLDDFWFWTFRYTSTYVSPLPPAQGLTNLAIVSRDIVPGAALTLCAAVVGAIGLAVDPARAHARALAGLFVLSSALAVTPGLYFRHHYFLVALPALALLAGLAPGTVARIFAHRPRLAAGAVAAVVAVPVLHALWTERVVLFRATPLEVARTIYGWSPFPESPVIGDYIRRHAAAGDTVAVLGSEPQIYYYAGRRAATRFIYMYPLMERHAFAARMQARMVGELEAAKPTYVVYVHVDTSWLATSESDLTLARWLGDLGTHFDRVGVVDIVSPDTTRYAWDDAARTYAPRSKVWLAVLRRKSRP